MIEVEDSEQLDRLVQLFEIVWALTFALLWVGSSRICDMSKFSLLVQQLCREMSVEFNAKNCAKDNGNDNQRC